MAVRKAKLVQVAGMKFEGTMDDGARTVIHTPGQGQTKEAPSPFEHVVLGLAGCTASDVVAVLEKKRQPLNRLEIDVEYDRADDNPRVLTRALLRFVAHGPVEEAALRRAIELSQEKYCSVSAMLRKSGAAITWDYRIEP